MAVGADRLNITSLVMKDSLLIVIGAEVLGIAGALILVKFLSTLLFGVKPMDPVDTGGGCVVVWFDGTRRIIYTRSRCN